MIASPPALSSRTRPRLLAPGLALALLTAIAAAPAGAATFTVDGTLDGGPGSLRQAILDANGSAGPDVVDFAPGVTGTITLLSALPAVADDVEILGPGAGALTVSGGNAVRVLQVASGVTATVSGLTLADGLAASGGAVINLGSLTIRDSTLSGNAGNSGGAVRNTGTLTVLDSTISGNTAIDGGGIESFGATLTIRDSTLAGNTASALGGAVAMNFGGTLTVEDTTFSDNTGSLGGAIYGSSTSTIGILRGTLADNSAEEGGGIFNEGSATLLDSTLSGNFASTHGGGIVHQSGEMTVTRGVLSANAAGASGGGIFNQGALAVVGGRFSDNVAIAGGGLLNGGAATFTGSTLTGNIAGQTGGGIQASSESITTISGSTLSGNAATGDGGGISNVGELTILNSTLSGNTAGDDGGGVFNFDTATLVHVTLWGNSASFDGGGIFTEGLTNVKSSVVGGTASGGECAGSPIDSFGQNLGTDGSCGGFAQVSPAELALGPLQAGGGPTETHPLLPGSVAIDAAADCTDAGGGPVAEDQRGRPRPAGSACDAGAFESQGPGTLTLEVDVEAALEGANGDGHDVVFTVARASADAAVTVDILFDPSSTATPGDDFTTVAALPVTVALPLGEGEATLTVHVPGDAVIEPDETIVLALANPTGGAVVGSPSTAGHTIVNDDFSVLEIPTLGPWGLGLLALLLAGAGLMLDRRRVRHGGRHGDPEGQRPGG